MRSPIGVKNLALAHAVDHRRHEGDTGNDDAENGFEARDQRGQCRRFGEVVQQVQSRGEYAGQRESTDSLPKSFQSEIGEKNRVPFVGRDGTRLT